MIGIDARLVPITVPLRIVRRVTTRDFEFYTMPGGLVGHCFYFNNTLRNVLTSVETRIAGCYLHGKPAVLPPQPAAAWNVCAFTRHLMRFMRYVECLTPEQACARFTGPRRALYEAALAEYYREGFQKKHMVLKGFLKAEAYEKLSADPRGIRPRHPVANIVFGQVIFPATPVLKKAINRWFRDQYGVRARVVLSGMDRCSIAKELVSGCQSIQKPVHFRIDGARFDRHVRKNALKWTHRIYRSARAVPRDTGKFMAWREQRDVNVFNCLDGQVKFVTEPTRTSGDDDTWLGNTLVACKMLDYIARKLVENGCKLFYVADTSDDMLVVVSEEFAGLVRDLINDVAQRFGFSFEVELESKNLLDVRWSQSFVAYDGTVYRLIRDIPRTLKRVFTTHQPLKDEGLRRAWQCAVAIGGLVEFGDVPVLRALYLMLLRQSGGARPCLLARWDEEFERKVHRLIDAERVRNGLAKAEDERRRLARFSEYYVEPTLEMWSQVCAVTGCPEVHLRAIEEELLKIPFTGVVERPYLEHWGGRRAYL